MTALRPTARVARGATYLFVQGFISAIIGLVYFVILAHILTTEEMGVFALLNFILTLIQVFGTLALPSATVKYMAQYVAEGKLEKAKSVVARVLQICLLTSAALSIIPLVLAEWLSMFVFGTLEYVFLFRLLAFASFFSVLNLLAMSFMQGLQRMREVAAISLVYVILQSSLGIYLLPSWRLYGVVFSWLVGILFSSLTGLVLTGRYLGLLGKPHPTRPLINFSYPLYISGILSFFAGWIDQLFILPFMGTVYLGIYYVAVRASAVPNLLSTSIVTALFPQLSELYTQRGLNSLKDAFRVSGRYAVLMGFPMIVGLASLARPIIILFTGMQYVEAALPLIIICLATLPSTVGVAIHPILMTLERTKTVSILTIVSILANMVVSYIALAYLNMGLVGPAWARTVASIIGFGLSVYALKLIFSLAFDKEALWKASASCIFMTAVIVLLDVFRQILTSSLGEFFMFQLRWLLIYVVIGAAAYFFSLVALRAIKKSDVELIHDYLPKGFKWIAVWLRRMAFVE